MLLIFFLISKLLSSYSLSKSFGEKISVGLKSMASSIIEIMAIDSDLEMKCDNEKKILKDKSYITLSFSSQGILLDNKIYKIIEISKREITGLIGINSSKTHRRYRGSFKIINFNSKVYPINIVNAEEYLYGVLPCEISSFYADEAIKAQAIAARTYLYKGLETLKYKYWDLVDTQDSQVYMGYNVETERFNRLVNETFNKVIVHNGRLIHAHYHSNSGGITCTPQDIWGAGNTPYLQPVNDSRNYIGSAESEWNLRIYKNALSKKVGFNVKKVRVENSKNGRVLSISLIGAKTLQISGEKFRSICSLPSTLFVIGNYSTYFTVKGRGSGHGIGLSQWGAYKLAERGYSHLNILQYYYKNVYVKDINDTYYKLAKRDKN